MFLNVHAAAPEGTGIPKTPEILNSLISLTSPPPPPLRPSQDYSTTALLSPSEETKSWQQLTELDGGPPYGNLHNGCPRLLYPQNGCPQLSEPHIGVHQPLFPCHSQSPSSHLLTPISDSAPSPDGGPPFQPYPPAPELASPVSTVEATRSALIKEGLKLTITSKLQQGGASTPGSEAFFVPDPSVVKTEQLTPEDEERRRRRRERNKVAATKCRNKKKEMTEILISESETVEEMNIRLKNEFRRLTEEKTRLQAYLSDESHISSCKHSRRPKLTSSRGLTSLTSESGLTSLSPPPSSVAKVTSPSNYSPCSSPCSFSSLMSPSDSKDFMSNISVSGTNPAQSRTNEDCEPNTPTLASLNVSCVPTSLDSIQATITSHEPASKTLSWTNSKPTPNYSNSCRYQPYGNWEHGRKIPSTTENLQLPIERMTSNYCATKRLDSVNNNYYKLVDPASTMYDQDKAISFFEKINPFRYPCTNKTSNDKRQTLNESPPFHNMAQIQNTIIDNGNDGSFRVPTTGSQLSNFDSIQTPIYNSIHSYDRESKENLTQSSVQTCSYTNL